METTGVCRICNKQMTKRGISRHIETHLQKEDGSQKGAREYYHIRITDKYAPFYWMNVLAYSKATLEDLDNFLRMMWLECCGHLSSFRINGLSFQVPFEDDWGWEETEDINTPIHKVLKKGLKFSYTYDFGSSTYLDLKVVSKHKLSPRTALIHLISRNNKPDIACEACQKKAAEYICSVCVYNDKSLFCKSCASTHAESCDGTEMLLPLVNSPRSGICAYTGDYDPETTGADFDLLL